MALTWTWKDKYGEMISEFRNPTTGEVVERKVDLYVGNCLMVAIYNYEENGKKMYSLDSFFVDNDHAKRCLGLDKKYGKDNMYDDGISKVVKLRIDKSKYSKAEKLIGLFVKAFDELTVELYKEEEE